MTSTTGRSPGAVGLISSRSVILRIVRNSLTLRIQTDVSNQPANLLPQGLVEVVFDGIRRAVHVILRKSELVEVGLPQPMTTQ